MKFSEISKIREKSILFECYDCMYYICYMILNNRLYFEIFDENMKPTGDTTSFTYNELWSIDTLTLSANII